MGTDFKAATPVGGPREAPRNGGGRKMTAKELSQLYWLGRELAGLKRRLEELEALGQRTTRPVAGTGRASKGGTDGDRVASAAVEIALLREAIEEAQLRKLRQWRRLQAYIDSIGDSQIRQIMTLRYVDGLSWSHVARKLGGGYTADSVRMAHQRFLSRQ